MKSAVTLLRVKKKQLAGVPLIPGHVEALTDAEEALSIARSIGLLALTLRKKISVIELSR